MILSNDDKLPGAGDSVYYVQTAIECASQCELECVLLLFKSIDVKNLQSV